MIEVLLESSF